MVIFPGVGGGGGGGWGGELYYIAIFLMENSTMEKS